MEVVNNATIILKWLKMVRVVLLTNATSGKWFCLMVAVKSVSHTQNLQMIEEGVKVIVVKLIRWF